MARLLLEKDRAIYIGPLAQNTRHRHFAVQWSLALNVEETLTLRSLAGTTTAKSAVILPGVEHDLQCSLALTLLVHPLSELGRCLQNEPITSQREDAIREAAEAGNLLLLMEELLGLTCASRILRSTGALNERCIACTGSPFSRQTMQPAPSGYRLADFCISLKKKPGCLTAACCSGTG